MTRLLSGRLLVRAATSAAFAGAAVAGIAAARERWWPQCPWFGFDNGSCLKRQDSVYNYVVPVDPWVPAGLSAQLLGVSLLLLAAALLLVPFAWRSRPGVLGWVLTVGAAAGTTTVAWICWWSGQTGEVVSLPGDGFAGVMWVLGAPVALGVVMVRAALDDTRVVWWRTAMVALVGVATNPIIGQLFLAPLVLGYASHDTTPWSDAVASAMLLLAAAASWPASADSRRTPARTPDDRASAAERT